MLFELNGPDILRVQRSATTRIFDPLDPDVVLSGTAEDGQGYVYQVAVNAPGIANTVNYTVPFVSAFSHSPIVFGGLKLTNPLVQSGQTIFNAGEYISPCGYRQQTSGSSPSYDYRFSFVSYPDRVVVSVGGMTGVVTLLVLETG